MDIEQELRQYVWDRERWTSDKLIACSPFRDDNAPSFFASLETGGWGDSGAYDSEYERGNFIKLIGYLRGTDPDEASEYLIDKYGALYEITEGVQLRVVPPKLSIHAQDYALTEATITPAISPYLLTRGIATDVQQRFGIGYNPRSKGYTGIPWHFADTGEIANVKYRSTSSKRFFYEADAKAINSLVYGLWQARNSAYVVICEGEVDALSWEVAGYTAVAIGGARMSDKQAELIIHQGFDSVRLAGDSDAQGRKFNAQMADKLRGYARLSEVDYGNEKDANDVLLREGVQSLARMFESAAPVRAINLRLS